MGFIWSCILRTVVVDAEGDGPEKGVVLDVTVRWRGGRVVSGAVVLTPGRGRGAEERTASDDLATGERACWVIEGFASADEPGTVTEDRSHLQEGNGHGKGASRRLHVEWQTV